MATRTIKQVKGIQLEELHLSVRKALGIALALSEKGSGDDHDTFAAEAITDYLVKAQHILEGEGVSHA